MQRAVCGARSSAPGWSSTCWAQHSDQKHASSTRRSSAPSPGEGRRRNEVCAVHDFQSHNNYCNRISRKPLSSGIVCYSIGTVLLVCVLQISLSLPLSLSLSVCVSLHLTFSVCWSAFSIDVPLVYFCEPLTSLTGRQLVSFYWVMPAQLGCARNSSRVASFVSSTGSF